MLVRPFVVPRCFLACLIQWAPFPLFSKKIIAHRNLCQSSSKINVGAELYDYAINIKHSDEIKFSLLLQ
jgi:hypothetical protein